MQKTSDSPLTLDKRKLVFQTLQPIFSQLLDLTMEPTRLAELFNKASHLMENDIMLRKHMNLCLDYVLFPFHLILPSIATTRKQAQPSAASTSSASTSEGCSMPTMCSPLAAEKALLCLQVILTLTPLQTPQQLSGLIVLLVELVHLDPSPTFNEEMCLSMLQSIRSAFASAPVVAQAALDECKDWNVTAGYLVHGLLRVAEREHRGGGFGALP
jgi:hypothetical protein